VCTPTTAVVHSSRPPLDPPQASKPSLEATVAETVASSSPHRRRADVIHPLQRAVRQRER